MIRLPGRCQVCNVALVWDGKRWKEPRQGAGRRHQCVDETTKPDRLPLRGPSASDPTIAA
jgi:hypothetical protein